MEKVFIISSTLTLEWTDKRVSGKEIIDVTVNCIYIWRK
jgi:hypothetical protein